MTKEEIDQEEQEFDKAVGQYRLRLHKLLKPLELYGQKHYVDAIKEELISLTIQFYHKMSGLDFPYHLNDIHW